MNHTPLLFAAFCCSRCCANRACSSFSRKTLSCVLWYNCPLNDSRPLGSFSSVAYARRAATLLFRPRAIRVLNSCRCTRRLGAAIVCDAVRVDQARCYRFQEYVSHEATASASSYHAEHMWLMEGKEEEEASTPSMCSPPKLRTLVRPALGTRCRMGGKTERVSNTMQYNALP